MIDPLEKLPRKLKKVILGKRLSKNRIKKLISKIKVTPATGHLSTLVEPFPFCPKCGCTGVRYSGNRVEYPERWDSGYCIRCGNHVWESDNSPYYHVLEMEDFSFS